MDTTATRSLAPRKIVTSTLTIRTAAGLEIHDLTGRLAALPGLDEMAQGTLLVQSLHTTTALCVNEAEPALLSDLQALLRRLVPPDGPYRHNNADVSACNRANAAGHLAAILLSHTVQVPVAQGRLVLGTWQRVLFCELDGPQTRRLHVQVMGA